MTVLNATEQFVDKNKATPIIETFLMNQQRKAIVEKTMLGLKNNAKIEFIGSFAGEKNTPAKSLSTNSEETDKAKSTENVISKGLKGL